MGFIKKKTKAEDTALPQQRNLVSAMKYSQSVTKITVIGAFSAVLVTCLFAFNAVEKAKNEIYVVDQKTGDVQVVQKARLVDHREVEVKANAELFVDRFFSINPTNWKNKVQSALDMGDGTVYRVYELFNTQKWYEDILQNNIFFTPFIYNYKADMSKQPYSVEFDVDLLLKSDVIKPQTWTFHFSCTMEEIRDRTDKTPHALFITQMIIQIKNQGK